MQVQLMFASSLRPKVFLVPRLAHHRRRCRPLRPHRHPRQLCVPPSLARVMASQLAVATAHLTHLTHLTRSSHRNRLPDLLTASRTRLERPTRLRPSRG
jgi:hypothetical protein